MKPVYLDYNATTPIDPGVSKVMLPYLGDEFGNPSSVHALGRRARDAVEAARAHHRHQCPGNTTTASVN
jgi:cysteine desulfurase